VRKKNIQKNVQADIEGALEDAVRNLVRGTQLREAVASMLKDNPSAPAASPSSEAGICRTERSQQELQIRSSGEVRKCVH